MSENARIFVVGKVSPETARQAVERDERRRRNALRLAPYMMNAYQRRAELQRLAQYRKAGDYALGSDAAWANVIANLCRVLHGYVAEELVFAEISHYGIGPMSFEVVADAVKHHGTKAWGKPSLFSPAHVGSLLELTSVERAEAGIEKIDACDESSADRKRRMDRQRKALKRAAKAALAPKPETKKQMADRLGISRTELYRRIKAGQL